MDDGHTKQFTIGRAVKPKAQTIVNVMKAFGWTGTRQTNTRKRKDPNVPQEFWQTALVSNVARVSNQSFLAEY